MEIEQTIRSIAVGRIDEMEWLKIRHTADDPQAEQDALHHLGLSMRAPNLSASVDAAATSLEQFLLDWPTGQLAPIRVIRYPDELHRFGKEYGLVFGYRRWHAAKRQGLPTINAQIIHLTADEYQNPKVRFWLRLMGLTENVARSPLSAGDYYKTIRWLKAQYETIYPEASRRFKHLTQARNQRGQLTHSRASTPGFATALAHVTHKTRRQTERDIRIAELLDMAILDHHYRQQLPQSAALILTTVPKEAQTAILDELARRQQPFTIENIRTAVDSYRKRHRRLPEAARHAESRRTANGHRVDRTASTATVTDNLSVTGRPQHHDGLQDDAPQLLAARQHDIPDLDLIKTTTKLCVDLRLHFPWSLASIQECLPFLSDLASASDLLVNHLERQKFLLQQGDNGAPRAPAAATGTPRHH